LVSDIKGVTQIEGVCEQGAEENILANEGCWRKLHNEELHNLYSLPSIIRMIKSRKMGWVGHVACMWIKKEKAYRILVGKPEGKKPLGRPGCRWKDNIKMHLREIG
jgi:hypothetical protein